MLPQKWFQRYSFVKVILALVNLFILTDALGIQISSGSRSSRCLTNFDETTTRTYYLKATPTDDDSLPSIENVEDASTLLADWDKHYNPETIGDESPEVARREGVLPTAVRLLSRAATEERNVDSTKGRCMLGICASSAEEGVATLKAWVTSLELPRGLLHGMDKDGVPLELNGGVYIKYNSGGVYTFADIRKSGMGFDALWKPGDALLEPYDGTYRGVYFQVELADGEFRQYLVPLDVFPDSL